MADDEDENPTMRKLKRMNSGDSIDAQELEMAQMMLEGQERGLAKLNRVAFTAQVGPPPRTRFRSGDAKPCLHACTWQSLRIPSTPSSSSAVLPAVPREAPSSSAS